MNQLSFVSYANTLRLRTYFLSNGKYILLSNDTRFQQFIIYEYLRGIDL